MFSWLLLSLLVIILALVAIAVFAPGSTSAQEGEEPFELTSVTLYAGGVALSFAYTVRCGPGDEGFKIRTNVASVNKSNGLIAKGDNEGVGTCPTDDPFGILIGSESDVAFVKGAAYAGGQQFCFGPLVGDEDVDCEPGGGGLLEGTIE